MRFNKTTLPNGLRIITVPMPDNPSVTILVMVEAGSKYEAREQSGLSHFLEHMVFKGTPRRPKATDISRELDSIGAQYNAFTSHEFTGYYAKADVRHADAILDIVSDLYLHPLFDEQEMKKEKGVIVEEIRMYKDIPQHVVVDRFMELLYGDQPAGWDIAGTEATVNSFSREQLVEYRSRNYVASATTIVVAGSMDEKAVLKKIQAAFADVSTAPKQNKVPIVESQTAPAIKAIFKETDQTHLIIGFRSFAVGDPRIPAMRVLATILGKVMCSRLFSKMRDELGICYYIRTEHDAFTDHGVLAISAGVDNSRVREGIEGILSELRRIRAELVPELELKKAKDHIAGTTMLELETSDARAEYSGMQEVMKKKVESPEILIKEIMAVSAKQVRDLAHQIFADAGMNLAIIGRFKDDSSFKEYFKLGP